MSRRGAGFRRASCPIIAIICDRAVVCCRCRSLCSLFCGCSCAVPAPATSPYCLSRSIGSWVYRVFSGLCRSSRWSGCRRFGLPARTRAVLERNGPAACFRGCCGAPSAPSGPCYLRGALWSAQEPHVYQKKLVLVRFIISLLSGHSAIRTTGNSCRKFAAGVTTRHIRNNALRRTKGGFKQVPKTQQTADLPGAIRHFS